MTEKYAYCLLHNKFFTDKTIKKKCENNKGRNPNQTKCKHLIVLKEAKK